MNAILINAGLLKNVSGLFTWGDTQLLREFDAQPEMWKQTLTLPKHLDMRRRTSTRESLSWSQTTSRSLVKKPTTL
ncbi:MAG: hypothetical protein IPI29_08425 [Ignavibacteria bacterium]|nr:hypothetical protein [Ignavibacteria bacterium]